MRKERSLIFIDSFCTFTGQCRTGSSGLQIGNRFQRNRKIGLHLGHFGFGQNVSSFHAIDFRTDSSDQRIAFFDFIFQFKSHFINPQFAN